MPIPCLDMCLLPFGNLGIGVPWERPARAGSGIRTRDLRITSAPLCQLSYSGEPEPPLFRPMNGS